MTFALLGTLTGALLGWLMGFLSLFLILLILIQRGKGGGLTGALGGPGGQSAFGSKAGDTFTVITIVVASIWGFTCAFTMWLLGTHSPTPVTKTNVQAGPGDEDNEPPVTGSDLLVPPAGGLGGFEGLDLSPNLTGDSESETPSMELTPADPTEGAADPAEGAADPAEDSDPAPETPSETPAPDSDSDPAETESGEEAESTEP